MSHGASETVSLSGRACEPALDPFADPVHTYLSQIGETPPVLERKEQYEYFKRIEAGLYAEAMLTGKVERSALDASDEELDALALDGLQAKNHIIKANLSLLPSIAKHYVNRAEGGFRHDLTFLELCQEGYFGLVEAVERFDYRKGFKFSTYADVRIRRYLQAAIPKMGRAMPVPPDAYWEASRAERVTAELARQLGRTPSIAQTAEALHISPARTATLLQVGRSVVSLHQPVRNRRNENGEEGGTIQDTLSVEENFGVADVSNACVVVEEAVAAGAITREAALVLYYASGFYDGTAYKMSEIAAIMDTSSQRVSRLLTKARDLEPLFVAAGLGPRIS